MTDTEIILIDLSSLAYPIWHTSQSNPDPNATSQQVIARVRAIATGKAHVAICCDSGRSFRHDIAPSYKANRPEQDGTLRHQIALACEQLKADGFPVWSVKGFEADDVIASATTRALETPELTVVIVTADKDLLQLVGPRVKSMSARDGSLIDAEGVAVKFGVRPDQMRDYLTLVGDSSDNVAGAKGIGPKKAADLLATFDSLDGIYEALESGAAAVVPSIATSLRDFKASGALTTTRSLIALRTDVDVPLESLNDERTPQQVEDFAPMEDEDMETTTDTHADAQPHAEPPAAPAAALAKREDAPVTTPVEWELELGPRSMREARVLAQDMFQSRLFSAYGTPQGVLSTVMLGRELGLPAMASLRGIHVIEGRHALSAQLMVALVLKSGFAEYFEPIEFDDQHAIFETHRKGARNPVRLEHTIKMAETAGLMKKDSNWVKVPTDMLVARAQSRLCRLVYPDVVGGLYTPDELADVRAQAA